MESTYMSISRKMDKENVVFIQMEYYLVIKKNEVLSFTGNFMELDVIMLGEISQLHRASFFLSRVEFRRGRT
jgi:hypothetical protein